MSDKVQVPSLPDVEIVDQNGKHLDTSAIDDYDSFMAFLMQASIAANTARMRKIEEDRVSKGEVVPFDLSITEEWQVVFCPHPCQTLYIENKGPGEIYVNINSRGDPTPIPPHREGYFPYENHVIKHFYVWTDPGAEAAAIAIAKY